MNSNLKVNSTPFSGRGYEFGDEETASGTDADVDSDHELSPTCHRSAATFEPQDDMYRDDINPYAQTALLSNGAPPSPSHRGGKKQYSTPPTLPKRRYELHGSPSMNNNSPRSPPSSDGNQRIQQQQRGQLLQRNIPYDNNGLPASNITSPSYEVDGQNPSTSATATGTGTGYYSSSSHSDNRSRDGGVGGGGGGGMGLISSGGGTVELPPDGDDLEGGGGGGGFRGGFAPQFLVRTNSGNIYAPSVVPPPPTALNHNNTISPSATNYSPAAGFNHCSPPTFPRTVPHLNSLSRLRRKHSQSSHQSVTAVNLNNHPHASHHLHQPPHKTSTTQLINNIPVTNLDDEGTAGSADNRTADRLLLKSSAIASPMYGMNSHLDDTYTWPNEFGGAGGPYPSYYSGSSRGGGHCGPGGGGKSSSKHLVAVCCPPRSSWKCIALAFILISLFLVAALGVFVYYYVREPKSIIYADAKPAALEEVTIDGSISRPLRLRLEPKRIVNVKFDISNDQRFAINLTLPENADIGLFATKFTSSSVLSHDMSIYPDQQYQTQSTPVLAAQQSNSRRRRRRAVDSDSTTFLEPGADSVQIQSDDLLTRENYKRISRVKCFTKEPWFLGLYNDESEPIDIDLSLSDPGDKSPGMSSDSNSGTTFASFVTDGGVEWSPAVAPACPLDCSCHGDCIDGQCRCYPGYQGTACAERRCPMICNDRGHFVNGRCECLSGWKGPECSVPVDHCIVPNCHGNGQCMMGLCRCYPGYKGEHCQEKDCRVSNCSGNGVCVEAECYCRSGYTGSACEKRELVGRDETCLQTCNHHGTFDFESNQCQCDLNWTGPTCDREVCFGGGCGMHGTCKDGQCVCSKGWIGARCDDMACDDRCYESGSSCNNGTCICKKGWNGKLCTFGRSS